MRFPIIGAFALASLSSAALADNVKPSVPENVSATALSDTSVRVTWSEARDNVRVDGYNIYRNKSYYDTVHDVTNYIDTRVSPGQTYYYSIVAFDDARNYTVLSEPDAVTPGGGGDAGAAPLSSGGNGQAPSAPSGLRADVHGGNNVTLYWTAASGGATGYNIYRDGSYLVTVRSTNWTDSGLAAGREYRYDVVAFSGDAKFSPHSDAVSVRIGGGSTQSAPLADAPSSSSGGYVPDGYRLVFSEEFDGSGVDSSKWNTRYRWGPNWTINNEQQYYVDTQNGSATGYDPFRFGGGKLEITADRTPGGRNDLTNGKSYVSGALTTFGKFQMRYGYVEMRAKMPRGQGLWPALWLLNASDNGNRPEIDIMEFLGRDVSTVYNVYHHYRGWQLRSTPSYEMKAADFTTEFHTFGMRWEPGKIVWYLDGREVNRYESGDVSNEDMYLIVNLALGGSWGGPVDGSTPFPARYTIDYVRAYQR